MQEATSLEGKAVLVVEDDMIIAMMIETILLDSGVTTVVLTETVQEALAHLSARRFDVAILDRQVADGLTFDVATSAQTQRTGIVMVSGASELGLPPALQGIAVLPKPFRAPDLIAAVASAIDP